MNTDKLERIKEALKLTVELAEKAKPGPWRSMAGNVFIKHDRHAEGVCHELRPEDATYIAHACNMGAPMANALLLAIVQLEISARSPITEQRAKCIITSIIDSFPDEI